MIYNTTGKTKMVDGHTLYEVFLPGQTAQKGTFWIDYPQILKPLKSCHIGQDTIIYDCTFTHSVSIGSNCRLTYSCFDCELYMHANCIMDNVYVGNLGFPVTFAKNIHITNQSFYGIGSYDKWIEENWTEYHWPGVSLLMGANWCRINCVKFDYEYDAAKLFDDGCWERIIAEKHPKEKSHRALVAAKPQIQTIIAAKLDELKIEYNKKEDCCN